jgi:hypothetical protein
MVCIYGIYGMHIWYSLTYLLVQPVQVDYLTPAVGCKAGPILTLTSTISTSFGPQKSRMKVDLLLNGRHFDGRHVGSRHRNVCSPIVP